jgi:F0F1-type ATP synthase membrane subunit b/b'
MRKVLSLAAGASVLVAAPVFAEEGGAAAGPLVVNGGLMIWTLVIFGILLLVLKKFAWPVVLGAVRDREKALEEQIAAAERNRAESARLLEEHKQLLDRAVQDLRREAVDLSLAAASRLIGQRLESDADRALVMNYLTTLEPQH